MRLVYLWVIMCYVVLICGYNCGYVIFVFFWFFIEGKEIKRCFKWRKIKLLLEYVFFFGILFVVLCV